MSKKKQWIETIEEMDTAVSPYSNHLLRHVLIPELLGEEEESILYWAGKAISRKLKAEEINDLPLFFEKANWGTLTLMKERRNEKQYDLLAPQMIQDRPFTLECGFLAQWTEFQTGFITEATYEIKKKKPLTCRITVRWDPKDKVMMF
ncbi:putative hydrocarbon binding protein [Evansella vedderi]|uniref:Hydrocarbon binding protein n=1 Tax=Evansella vedderi TaxID=38282 RepID=A0ABT9ZYY0_9BACI|nr:YslB family protein [Evansella vedderi]MDQ0256459.1 putative hydrocarbon binding protein [Evansella vedderi]